ncbi:MAG: rhodanese-like domain-containing protein [Nitrospirae bacterium]|nr:rhodanese-like domain-containing protein [Nitrospirota bacterium]
MYKKSTIAILALFIVVVVMDNYASAITWLYPAIQEMRKLKQRFKENESMPYFFEDYTKITGGRLKGWIDDKKKFILLDVRPKKDYENEHIIGAESLPFDELFNDPTLINKYDLDSIVVVYCDSEMNWEAATATFFLEYLGFSFTKIYWYRVGIVDWIKRGYPTEKADK